MPIKAGDIVTVVKREVTAEDQKSGLYYAYFGGLTGRVDRVYPDGSVCVDVDIESLSEEARARHLAIQEFEQQRWLEGLSEEVRSRLTPEQRQLKMSYRILVSASDLQVVKPVKSSDKKQPREDEAKATTVSTQSTKFRPAESEPQRRQRSQSEQPRRLSEADLNAAEEAYLKSRKLRGSPPGPA